MLAIPPAPAEILNQPGAMACKTAGTGRIAAIEGGCVGSSTIDKPSAGRSRRQSPGHLLPLASRRIPMGTGPCRLLPTTRNHGEAQGGSNPHGIKGPRTGNPVEGNQRRTDGGQIGL